jgi:hypothetical protein
MELAIVSDTHVPSRADEIPDWVADRLREADHTLHAGDFDSAAALETVERLSDGGLTAVAGNMDHARLGLPDVAVLTVEGVEFVVLHGTGERENYERRVADAVRQTAGDSGTLVGVCGHTHEYIDETVDGVRLLNPGSATGAPPAEETTMLTVAVEAGTVEATVHRGPET